MRNFFHRMGVGFRNFMSGRYGADKLNLVILISGVIASMLSSLIPAIPVKMILFMVSYGLLLWAMFRMLSRNTYKRYEENRKFLLVFQKLRDHKHKYFYCPRCRQQVRVPRGKGTIVITCPKCREKFTRKT